MRQVAAAIPPDLVAFQVLHEGSTHRDVDHLLTPADAEDRQTLLARLLEEPQLGVVELAVDRPDLGIRLFSVEGRVDVPATRQQKTIHLRQRTCARRQVDRLRPDRLDRTPVRDVIVGAALLAGRDPNPRAAISLHVFATRLRAGAGGLSRTRSNGPNQTEMKCL